MNSFFPFLAFRAAPFLFATTVLSCFQTTLRADDPYAPKPAIPPGYVLIEGDILVSEVSPQAVYTTTQLWPNGTVPYEFDANVTAANQTNMLNAMAMWQAVANVQFVVRSGESAYAHIQDSTKNSSAVGRQGNKQFINIFNWGSQFIIAHELGHCLGFWHEQSRSDRTNYISVNLNNVAPDNKDNFDVHDEASHYGPYDFDSVMHYGALAFSTNGQQVITILPPYVNTNCPTCVDVSCNVCIGQRTHLSDFDMLTMSFLYPQSNWRFVDRNFTGSPESGTFLRPYKAFATGETGVPSGGTVWIQPGTYSAVGTHSKPMSLRAPLGGVTLSD